MQHKPSFATSERWFDSACVQEMDSFINTLSATTKEEQQLRPDLIGSTIMHYASKWLPELAQDEPVLAISSPDHRDADSSSASITASWLKKKFFVESITGILPPEKESIPCDFLLRLLRIGNMVCADPTYLEELERRVSWTLDQASLKEVMIPSFSHTCDTLLDVDLVMRLVRRFVSDGEGVVKGGGALVKVGKLVDCYLAEVAVDGGLRLSRFEELANSIPSHVRVTDDGLYRAIDTYLKAHPLLSKQERKTLWDLIDARKLSQEASFHASQNKRLPVRAIIQVLLSERTKLNRNIIDWSGSSFRRTSPAGTVGQFEHAEIKRLKEDVLKLQSRCMVMESQMEKLLEMMKTKKKSSSAGYFGLKKIGIYHALLFKGNKINGVVEGELAVDGFGFKTPVRSNRRRSMS